MFELSKAMGHESYDITDRTYAHLRKKGYSAHRARFSAHVGTGGATAPEPILLRASKIS